jgi:hypothetical protein
MVAAASCSSVLELELLLLLLLEQRGEFPLEALQLAGSVRTLRSPQLGTFRGFVPVRGTARRARELWQQHPASPSSVSRLHTLISTARTAQRH